MNKNIISYLLLYENYCQNRNAPSKQLSLILIPLCLSPPKQHRFLKPKQSLILIPLCYFSPLFQYPYAFKGYEIRGPKVRKYRGRWYVKPYHTWPPFLTFCIIVQMKIKLNSKMPYRMEYRHMISARGSKIIKDCIT